MQNVVNDLAVYPTQDLITELLKRCSPAVFIGTKYEESGEHKTWMSFGRHQGNLATCYGLCHEIAFEIKMEKIQRILGGESC
jgi:hypothetical protein